MKREVLISREEDAKMVAALSELRLQGVARLPALEAGRNVLATHDLFDQLR